MNAQFVTPSHITRMAYELADVCQATGIPYTVVELQACVAVLIKLYDVSVSDDQARTLFT